LATSEIGFSARVSEELHHHISNRTLFDSKITSFDMIQHEEVSNVQVLHLMAA
jgi:hypothetical protein